MRYITLTLILNIFLISCSSNAIREITTFDELLDISDSEKKHYLNVNTSEKNKEYIVEYILENDADIVLYSDINKTEIPNDLLTEIIPGFCNSFDKFQEISLVNSIEQNIDLENELIIVFNKNNSELINRLKDKYPKIKSYQISNNDKEEFVKSVLGITNSERRFKLIDRLDPSNNIQHYPRIRKDFSSILFLINSEEAQKLIPYFRNYAVNINYYSKADILYDKYEYKKILDYEDISIPVNPKLFQSPENEAFKIVIEKELISDFLVSFQVLDNGINKIQYNSKISKFTIENSGCINRNPQLWKIKENII